MRLLPRLLTLLLILSLTSLSLYVAFYTAIGAELRHNPHTFHTHAQSFAAAHPILTPTLLIVLYTLLSISMVPILWLPMLAGAAFGMVGGVFWSLIAATTAGTSTFLLSRWVAADFFHKRVESRLEKLRSLDQKLSHNGLLVVMVARLAHVLPFGPSYYMFGLTTMTPLDVLLGTLLGYLPTCMLLVRTGAGWNTGDNFRFVAILLITQGLLLLPVLLRYLYPRWFRKVGIE